ncbi:MAG: hypothetical protein ACW981_15670 [Candidatus Hodarchaeales archaeon]|jgi:uncharacterized protein YbaR (Trm112 family)
MNSQWFFCPDCNRVTLSYQEEESSSLNQAVVIESCTDCGSVYQIKNGVYIIQKQEKSPKT